ncbi:class IIb bacteriocin, lactobin A/cerein 7B family [Carboxylicivirga mesophila]|uniref:Class IIb bacteriocin, lactobin A/cerein 7B family n=1 Tax=Carboxylicivirga mesophila TaxID=1166478 RepID=A0ABS5K620_9BACT|nr:class IIb bacteriocin, lactobin A/cerein 7B family [Carboxylicivirga mesophila]MBS2209823.1 class IIb bacteriocin, lactobin A/cerein 7B family [Carboxylicivirga mesophila]
MKNIEILRELDAKELKETNGGITPFGAVLTVFGVIGAVEYVAYGIGYAHGWVDKQIEKMSND